MWLSYKRTLSCGVLKKQSRERECEKRVTKSKKSNAIRLSVSTPMVVLTHKPTKQISSHVDYNEAKSIRIDSLEWRTQSRKYHLQASERRKKVRTVESTFIERQQHKNHRQRFYVLKSHVYSSTTSFLTLFLSRSVPVIHRV